MGQKVFGAALLALLIFAWWSIYEALPALQGLLTILTIAIVASTSCKCRPKES